ncbi:uncharacterized protein LOC131932473 [Physella acuta]|uniref:uncharacterized protein LOC131932473 n=1 Tax=Physella acuta TaxID=109671 RepID=UPI0027DE952C|nr:uncharacterized protein LOC131932473 [Physella acuta]
MNTKRSRSLVYWSAMLVLTSLHTAGAGTFGNEDWDNNHFQIKTVKPLAEIGLSTLEGHHGIPVPIDSLFTQISSTNTDDQSQPARHDCVKGSELSELDMCLTPSQATMFDSVRYRGQRKRRQASANGFSLWKNGIIPYVFNFTFPPQDRDAILSAMAEWEKATCIRFRLASADDTDVVVFRDGRRCSTNIGRIGGQQAVTLAKTCRSKRILIHELGHVLGLIHEHQRHDRDKYVRVLLENVRNMSQERYQFSKLLTGSITDKTVKYDYTSVMHYGRNYFARSPDLTTLQTTDRRYQDIIGRAEKPSYNDVETVNRLYHCAAGCHQSIQCGDLCYLDNTCTCKCPAVIEKASPNDPVPSHNSLQDSTCDFFASRGECTGNIKDTVRPLCAKSCGLQQAKLNNLAWPANPLTTNQLQPKPATSVWGTTPEVHNNLPTSNSNSDINIVNDIQLLINGETQSLVRPRSGYHTTQELQEQTQRLELEISQQAQDRRAGVRQFPDSTASQNMRTNTGGGSLLHSLIAGGVPRPGDERNTRGQIYRQANEHLPTSETTKHHVPTTILDETLPPDSQNANTPFNPITSYQFNSSPLQRQQLSIQQQHSQLLHEQQNQRDIYGKSRAGFQLSRTNQHYPNGFGTYEQTRYNQQNENIHQSFRGNNFFNGNYFPSNRNQNQRNPPSENIPPTDVTGPEFGPFNPASPTPGDTNFNNGPDLSRTLQTIGPSFMKSGPQHSYLGESRPSQAHQSDTFNKNYNEPLPTAEQNVYYSGVPQQTFEPTFSDGSLRPPGLDPTTMHAPHPPNNPGYSNTEPFIESSSYANQPGIPVDQTTLLNNQPNQQQPGIFNNRIAAQNIYNNNNGNMHSQPLPNWQQRQQRLQDQRNQQLFQMLQLAFTDPTADVVNIQPNDNNVPNYSLNTTRSYPNTKQQGSITSLFDILRSSLADSSQTSSNQNHVVDNHARAHNGAFESQPSSILDNNNRLLSSDINLIGKQSTSAVPVLNLEHFYLDKPNNSFSDLIFYLLSESHQAGQKENGASYLPNLTKEIMSIPISHENFTSEQQSLTLTKENKIVSNSQATILTLPDILAVSSANNQGSHPPKA